jgi:hypothetical protein
MVKSRRKSRPKAPPDKARDSANRLRQLHAEGEEIHAWLQENAKPGKRLIAIQKEAARRGLNRDYVCKAVQLVDPKTGISREDFQRLCKWAEKHGRIVGRGFVARLLSVPKRSRMSMAERYLKEGWSLAELDYELARRYGRRRQGGRRPRMLMSLESTLVGIEGRCLSWSRLNDFLYQPRGDDPPHQHRVHLEDLPDDVRRCIVAMDRAVRQLRQAVSNHLSKARKE